MILVVVLILLVVLIAYCNRKLSKRRVGKMSNTSGGSQVAETRNTTKIVPECFVQLQICNAILDL